MTKSILTIIPSRGRPELLLEMLGSWDRTRCRANRHKCIIYISPDDPRYKGYKGITPHLPADCEIICGPRRYTTPTFNAISFENPEYEYLAPMNDDFYCVTPDWDEKLIKLLWEKSNGWGCAMAADKLTNWKNHPHPAGCIISRKTIDAVGYMFWPKVHHIGSDMIMGKLYTAVGILHGTEDVMIEHRHWSNGMRCMDDNYRWVYSKEEVAFGNNAYMDFLYDNFDEEVRKLREAMANENK